MLSTDTLTSICSSIDTLKHLGIVCCVNKTFRNYLCSPAGAVHWVSLARSIRGSWEPLSDVELAANDMRYVVMARVCVWLLKPRVFTFMARDISRGAEGECKIQAVRMPDSVLQVLVRTTVGEQERSVVMDVEPQHDGGGFQVIRTRDLPAGERDNFQHVMSETERGLLERAKEVLDDMYFQSVDIQWAYSVHDGVVAIMCDQGGTVGEFIIFFATKDFRVLSNIPVMKASSNETMVIKNGQMWIVSDDSAEIMYYGPSATKTFGASAPVDRSDAVFRSFVRGGITETSLNDALSEIQAIGADITVRCRFNGWGLIHYAADTNNPAIIRRLVSLGVPVDYLTRDWEQQERASTALCIAGRRGFVGVVELLLNMDANMHLAVDRSFVRESTMFLTPVEQAVYSMWPIRVLKLFMRRGIDVNARSAPDGSTLLFYVGSHVVHDLRTIKTMKLLHGAGADVNMVNYVGEPLVCSWMKCWIGATRNPLPMHSLTLATLCAFGADVNAWVMPEQYTALMMAVIFFNIENIRTIISLGASVFYTDAQGRTALAIMDQATVHPMLPITTPYNIRYRDKARTMNVRRDHLQEARRLLGWMR